ncbi:HNH endonuclease signature motif containing protein [Arthrobacter oryzae]|uniref:HNH endonuclease signature motif containing protein n=1 Tax=Arthrobacter oryzae TaxID=409290 RepID=UPI0030C963DE
MEAVGEREVTGGALRWAKLPAVTDTAAGVRPIAAHSLRSVAAGQQNPEALASDDDVFSDLARSLRLLKAMGSAAVGDTAGFGVREAADFAAGVEEISRTLEYLQVVAAGAVDRTRRNAQGSASSGAAVGWTTGWGSETAVQGPIGWGTSQTDSRVGGGTVAGCDGDISAAAAAAGPVRAFAPAPAEPDPADDGCRNAAEFLRGRLRISVAEARRRISLAESVLPRTGITGHTEPPERAELAAAVSAGTVASRSATIITLALERVGHHAPEDAVARMEHHLTRAAAEHDTDFLARVARRWIDGLDQDGSEPSEEELRRRQGVFLRQPRRGLHHVEIFATPDQYEPLLTAMNIATNPRTRSGDADTAAADALDLRTRQQRLLDGLVGAVKAGLTTGGLPAAGGLRPQVMVTIDYRDLLERLDRLDQSGTTTDGTPGSRPIPGTGTGTGSFTFTGPVTASTVRKIACDADIIPVLLGSEGRVLDVGRTTRIFPPHIRKAITARDQGCAFPDCTIPAPWCEAHHISYWSHGGTTSTDNGTLLCSHHHHLIHKEQWHIQVKTGVPWFIPPPHIDPRRKPRRNHYFNT